MSVFLNGKQHSNDFIFMSSKYYIFARYNCPVLGDPDFCTHTLPHTHKLTEGHEGVHLLSPLHHDTPLSSPSSVLSLHSWHRNQAQRGNASLHADAQRQPLSSYGLADEAMRQSAVPVRGRGLIWLGLPPPRVTSALDSPAQCAPFVSSLYRLSTNNIGATIA